MTAHVPSRTDTSPAVVDILTRLVQVLDLADREARYAAKGARTLRLSSVSIESSTMCIEAVAMLPDQLFPDIDRPAATGVDPIRLLRQAEQMTCELPIEHFPAGMSQLILRLIDTIRDYS